MILDEICNYTIRRLEKEKKENFSKVMEESEKINRKALNFKEIILADNQLGIIAEIKKASPSMGIIREKFNVEEIVDKYSNSNIQCVSILTEPKFFKGSREIFEKARQIIDKPLLRKDFIIDKYQIDEAYIMGADAILLIASINDYKRIEELNKYAHYKGMQTLVEIHSKEELEKVSNIEFDMLGINNRNLKTFEIDIKNTEKLLKYVPANKVIISESGVENREDIKYLESLGVDGALIGTSFMESLNIGLKIRELRGLND